jgi:uncharacterized protein YigA (DUF484 family)
MNKDQVAIYLNEHPEFFNEYPELLKKIKDIEEEDLPIEPMSTLSLVDRIIKRVHETGCSKFLVPTKKFRITCMKSKD